MEIEYSNDMLNLFCGKLLGEGTYRKVFEMRLDPSMVVKRDSGANWSNISEWQLYSELHDTPIGKWMAPCWHISPMGLWLVQARTTPILFSDLPKEVPAIFADTKQANWGWFEGRAVCHDYGNHMAYRLSNKPGARMKTPTWREGEG